MDLQGAFVKIGDLIKLKGVFLWNSYRIEKFSKAPAQRALLNVTGISLEFSEFHQNFTRISLESH